MAASYTVIAPINFTKCRNTSEMTKPADKQRLMSDLSAGVTQKQGLFFKS
jgi:hypothetical protein